MYEAVFGWLCKRKRPVKVVLIDSKRTIKATMLKSIFVGMVFVAL